MAEAEAARVRGKSEDIQRKARVGASLRPWRARMLSCADRTRSSQDGSARPAAQWAEGEAQHSAPRVFLCLWPSGMRAVAGLR